jgi:hypothetical protein
MHNKNAYKILVRNFEGKRPPGISKGNIKTDVTKWGLGGLDSFG